MKSLTGKKYAAVNHHPGSLGFYVGGWHKIQLGEKVKVGKKDMGYAVKFIAYGPYEMGSSYGKEVWCITEETLAKDFKEVK